MVNQRGQSATEFILMLALLTGVGIAIFQGFGSPGAAVDTARDNAISRISDDKD